MPYKKVCNRYAFIQKRPVWGYPPRIFCSHRLVKIPDQDHAWGIEETLVYRGGKNSFCLLNKGAPVTIMIDSISDE